MLSILNLVICSDDDNEKYNEMYKCLTDFYLNYEKHKNVFVKTYFLKLKEDIDNYKLEDNILYIKGKESFIPGIIEKTLKGFQYFSDQINDYQYIIRSNLSTIIDFEYLAKELDANPIHFYGGGHKRNLQWEGGGINDSTWFGTDYIEGTSIIFTPKSIQYILDNIGLVRTNIIDDVSIAIFMREHAKNEKIQDIHESRYAFVECFVECSVMNNRLCVCVDRIRDMVLNNKFIFYRNKCCKYRKIDSIQMNIIKDIIIEREILNKNFI